MSLPSKKLLAHLKPGYYPVVKIPYEYTEALGPKVQPPTAPEKPLPPKKPIFRRMPEPQPPKRTALSWIGLDSNYIFENHMYKKAVKDLPGINEQLKHLHKISSEAYERDLKKYNDITLRNYENKHKTYQDILTLTRSHISDTNSRKKLLALRMKDALKPRVYPENSSVKRGLTESYFESYLEGRYQDNLLPYNATITSSENEFQRPYIPDFVLSFKDNSFIIDIEIDEPYVASSHEPIHFLKDLNENKRKYSKNFVDIDLRHVDESRDAFFIESGWIVIRFTEKQVINAPFLCLDLIDLVVDYLMQVPPSPEHPTSDAMIESERMWTQWMAVNLASKNYRQSYLPPKLSQAAADARKTYLVSRPSLFDDDNDLPF